MIWLLLMSCSDVASSDAVKKPSAVKTKPQQGKRNGLSQGHRQGNPNGHPPHGHPQGGPPKGKPSLKVKPTFSWMGEAKENPKSIVIISLDTVRADRLSVYGGRALTPSLQKLADAGLLCTQAVTHFPETALDSEPLSAAGSWQCSR